MPDGILGQFRHRVKIGLFHDVFAVCFDGLDADMKRIGDIFGAAALGDQLQHFTLPGAQFGAVGKNLIFRRLKIFIDEKSGDPRAQANSA